jgi:hypothetical protein
VGPAGYLLDGRLHLHESGRADYSIGAWIGISGAAFTTSVGRATTLGLSLPLGLANVRLGVWWRSALGRNDVGPGLERLSLRLFPTRTYLGYELLRPERDVSLIVVGDNGCDPGYRFEDLATLFRLARIDQQAQFRLVSDFDSGTALDRIFGRDDEFGKDDGAAQNKYALL